MPACATFAQAEAHARGVSCGSGPRYMVEGEDQAPLPARSLAGAAPAGAQAPAVTAAAHQSRQRPGLRAPVRPAGCWRRPQLRPDPSSSIHHAGECVVGAPGGAGRAAGGNSGCAPTLALAPTMQAGCVVGAPEGAGRAAGAGHAVRQPRQRLREHLGRPRLRAQRAGSGLWQPSELPRPSGRIACARRGRLPLERLHKPLQGSFVLRNSSERHCTHAVHR